MRRCTGANPVTLAGSIANALYRRICECGSLRG